MVNDIYIYVFYFPLLHVYGASFSFRNQVNSLFPKARDAADVDDFFNTQISELFMNSQSSKTKYFNFSLV